MLRLVNMLQCKQLGKNNASQEPLGAANSYVGGKNTSTPLCIFISVTKEYTC